MSAKLPLEGVRVVDMSLVWAGTFGTMLLADLGAEVIKVENPFVWQPYTRGQKARPTKEMIDAGTTMTHAYPNNQPGPRPWNYCPTFVQLYRNKKSFTVDHRTEEGMAVLKRLIAMSDVVYENNAVGTWDKLGLSYEALCEIKRDVIMVRVPAFGTSGPYAHARALGIHLEDILGHALLRGYRDLDVSQSGWVYSADYMGGANGALAAMMALWHRDATGEGQLVEVPQAEGAASVLFQAFVDYGLNGREQERLGNRSVYGYAPSGVYPCASDGTYETGDDHWISITVTSDDEWTALRQVMGNPDWASDASFATREGRAANQDDLDTHIADWTRGQDDYELFHRLQAAGVPAAPVLEVSRAFDDPQVVHRGVYQPQTLEDDVGTYRFMTPFYRFSKAQIGVRNPPVAFGADNEYVYRELLGVSDDEFERLRANGHIAREFDAAIP